MIGHLQKGENHFLEKINNPNLSTDEMKFGSALHDAVLLPETFKDNYGYMPKFDKRTRTGKEGYDNYIGENPNKIFLSNDDLMKIENMKTILMGNDLVKSIYELCEKEVSMFSLDKLGIRKKGRADLISVDECLLADLKTTADCSPQAFLKSIINYGYDRQAAYYCDLATEITGKTFDTFIFITIEKTPPFEIAVYSLDKKFLDRGRELYHKGLVKFKKLLEMNEGSYDFSNFTHRFKNETVELLECPKWALKGV